MSVPTPLVTGALALLASACLAADAWRDVATAHQGDAFAATAYVYVEGTGATVDGASAVDEPRDAVADARVQASHVGVAGRLHRLRQATADTDLADHSARAPPPPEAGAGEMSEHHRPPTTFPARPPGRGPDAVPDDAEAQHDATPARAPRTENERDTVLLAHRWSGEHATGRAATEEP
jgi:hypothetical protein